MKSLKDRVVRTCQKFLVEKNKGGRYNKLYEAVDNLVPILGGFSYSEMGDINAKINSMGNSDPITKANLYNLLALYNLNNNWSDFAIKNFRGAAKSYREGALGSRREDYLNASKEAMRNAKAVSYHNNKYN